MRRRHALSTAALVIPLIAGALVLPVVAGASSPAGQPPLTSAQAKALSTDVSDKVIVVFKNQLSTTPDTRSDIAARTAAADQVQSGVVHELSLTGAKAVKQFQLINAVSATVSPGEASRLKANPAVAEVVRDEPIPRSRILRPPV